MINNEILKWIMPILIGAISALIASTLALRKFKKEKTWDDRRRSYKDIIEAFEELIYWAEEVRSEHFLEPQIGAQAKYYESLRTLSKYNATGSFVLSKKFHEELQAAYSKIQRLRFEIEEERKPDMGDDHELAKWRLILAKGIREISEESLPKLILTANNERE